MRSAPEEQLTLREIMRGLARYTVLAALMLVIGIAGCSNDNPVTPNTPSTGTNTSHAEITYTPEAKVFTKEEMGDVTQIDSNNLTFHIRSSNPKAAALAKGDVIVIGEYAIRRVKSVSNSGGNVVVQTDTCAITEAIQDADISWDYEVKFTPQFFKNAFGSAFGKGAKVEQVAEDILKVSFEDKPFAYEIEMKLEGDKAHCIVTMEKKIKDVKVAEFKVQGTLNKFRSKLVMQIKDRKLLKYEQANNQLNVDFTVTYAVIGSGVDLGYTLTIPLIKVPIPNVPFIFLEYSTQVVLNASVPVTGSSNLGVRFNLNADQGFQFLDGGKNITATGALKSEKIEKTKEPMTGAPGPMGLSWGINFPRIEISIPGITAGWVQSGYLVGGDYTMMPPCQQAKAQLIGSCGWSLGAFGVTIASGNKTLWSKEKVLLKAGQCP
jgi:hypothetical protein